MYPIGYESLSQCKLFVRWQWFTSKEMLKGLLIMLTLTHPIPGKVVRLDPTIIPQLSEVLARSFQSDSMFAYIFPREQQVSPGHRHLLMTQLMHAVLRYGVLFGEVYTTFDRKGAAIWLPPNETPMALGGLVQSGLLSLPFKLGFSAFQRFLRVMDYAEQIRAEQLPVSHWRLLLLGVEPIVQGQGIGSELIQPVLTQADDTRALCYVETLNPLTLEFYLKHGFQLIHTGKVPYADLCLWSMKRTPRYRAQERGIAAGISLS